MTIKCLQYTLLKHNNKTLSRLNIIKVVCVLHAFITIFNLLSSLVEFI